MESVLLCVGKTDDSTLERWIDTYKKRLQHYTRFSIEYLNDIKKTKHLSETQQKEAEGKSIVKTLKPGDRIFLLDEGGKQYSSIQFSQWVNKQYLSGGKRLVFIVGGPYGFSEEIYQKAQGKISLSAMTFSHQMVRLFFIEQLYRAHTILKNEPYHHQ